MTLRRLASIALLALALHAGAAAQGVRTVERFTLRAADSVVTLAHGFVVPASVRVVLDSVPIDGALLGGITGGVGDAGDSLPTAPEFFLDARYGRLRFTAPLLSRLADTTHAHHLEITYRYRPINLLSEYFQRRLVTVVDSTGARTTTAQAATELTTQSIFGRNFQRSGSIVRGFTVGSNRDLTVQSGLRLQFSGMVTDDVEVLGALTDEQTPIQPEGNTQTLREIDNIFIEIRSPHAGATLGKFVASNPGAGYLSYERKLQGVRAVARYGDIGTTEVVAAVAQGRFRTQQMEGRERDQGPYRLVGQFNERNIVVVAGTERVFVDGVEMVRGESNDYVIDYGAAEIFFQTRRPITALSRITVDFEYADRQYSRSFISVMNTGRTADSALTVTAGYLREGDNQDAAIDISLSDGDRALLAAAGSDRRRAIRSGVTFVGRTDSVSGSYRRVDTLIDGRPDSVFVYAPSDPAAVYDVIFSSPPDGIGDYRNIAFSQFEFVGRGLGSYLPVIYLPLPELRQVAALSLHARPASWFDVTAEAAYSDASLNRFSTAADAHLSGTALSLAASLRRDSLAIGGTDIGGVRFGARAQYVAAGFRSIDRLGEVEFQNRWNAGEIPGIGRSDNIIVEDTLVYLPHRRLLFSAANGLLRQGSLFRSLRQEYSARLAGDTVMPSADYTFELITTDTAAGTMHTSWLRQRGGVGYDLGVVVPAVRGLYEHRDDRAGDTTGPASFRAIEWGPDITFRLPVLLATASARFRVEDSVRYDVAGGRLVRDGSSGTYSLHGELRAVRDANATLDVTYRRRGYDSVPGADPSGRLDNTTLLARTQARWAGFDRGVDVDALYEVQTEQAARLQRLFVQVPFGRGEYSWTDVNGDGRQSEDEFRVALSGEGEYLRFDVPTEQLYPVINLRSSTRLRLQPRRFLTPASWLGRLLAPVSTETYLRLEEKSQTAHESDIYLLRLRAFQNDSTTLVGTSTVQQDVNLFETNPEYSFRLRWLDTRGLTRLVSTLERTRQLERSLRSRWQPTTDIGLQLDLGFNSGLLRSSDTASTRAFDLTSFTATSDFSYRPEQSLELGWQLRLTSSRDVYPQLPRTTALSGNAVRCIYSIETRARLRVELERTSVTGTNVGSDPLALPYQLTDGYALGVTWTGRATFEYRIGANIQASLNYTGRAQPPGMRVVHIGQAEVRAFF